MRWPQRVQTSGSIYELPFGTTVGASWFGSSGVPITRWANYRPGLGFAVFYKGRGSDGRMPFVSRLDLQVQHRIRLSERIRLTLTATAFNLLNQVTPTDRWSQELFFQQAIRHLGDEVLRGRRHPAAHR